MTELMSCRKLSRDSWWDFLAEEEEDLMETDDFLADEETEEQAELVGGGTLSGVDLEAFCPLPPPRRSWALRSPGPEMFCRRVGLLVALLRPLMAPIFFSLGESEVCLADALDEEVALLLLLSALLTFMSEAMEELTSSDMLASATHEELSDGGVTMSLPCLGIPRSAGVGGVEILKLERLGSGENLRSSGLGGGWISAPGGSLNVLLLFCLKCLTERERPRTLGVISMASSILRRCCFDLGDSSESSLAFLLAGRRRGEVNLAAAMERGSGVATPAASSCLFLPGATGVADLLMAFLTPLTVALKTREMDSLLFFFFILLSIGPVAVTEYSSSSSRLSSE